MRPEVCSDVVYVQVCFFYILLCLSFLLFISWMNISWIMPHNPAMCMIKTNNDKYICSFLWVQIKIRELTEQMENGMRNFDMQKDKLLFEKLILIWLAKKFWLQTLHPLLSKIIFLIINPLIHSWDIMILGWANLKFKCRIDTCFNWKASYVK